MRAPSFATALAVFALSVCASTIAVADDTEDTILIMDASGSMWGQIDGVNKIVIAKEVMEGLIRTLPEQRRLGLVAYGHRRKGDCADIETLAKVGDGRSKLIAAVRDLNPRGKTPLSASVKHAAEELDYTKKKTTVILVSDGKETCAFDPCELGRILEAQGLDFTVHVVGFDVTEEERKGLQCLASETGGQFLAADNAAQLTQALATVAEVSQPQVSTPVPSQLVLKATILPGGPQINDELTWTVTPQSGGAPVFSANDAGVAETEIEPGKYEVRAVWSGWREGGEKIGTKSIESGPQNVHVVTIPIELGLNVTLDAPAQAMEAEPVPVTWSGPDHLGAIVSIAELDDAPSDSVFFFSASKARKAHENETKKKEDRAIGMLSTPPIPGRYEVRYALTRPAIVLARRPIELTARSFSLDAPASLPVSTPIEVSWTGIQAKEDILSIVPKGDSRKFDNARYTRADSGNPVKLTTPPEPGEYEIRYLLTSAYSANDDHKLQVKASRPLTVTAVEASLEAPATAVGGSTIPVTWSGPAGFEDDMLTIVEPGSTKFNRDSNAPVAVRGEKKNPVEIRVHAIPGDYEIAYMVNPGRKIVARKPITITAAKASVSAPDTAKAGEPFEVSYSGDGFKGDRVVLVEAGYPDEKMWGVTSNYGFPATPAGSKGTIPGRLTTDKPGVYELRYVTGLQHQILARAKVTITP